MKMLGQNLENGNKLCMNCSVHSRSEEAKVGGGGGGGGAGGGGGG
jgi:hypothetical protein